MEKLKPCPFCGKTDHLEFIGTYVDRLCGEPPVIRCVECGAELLGRILIPGHSSDYFGQELSEKEMRKLDLKTEKFSNDELKRCWNTRPLEEKK